MERVRIQTIEPRTRHAPSIPGIVIRGPGVPRRTPKASAFIYGLRADLAPVLPFGRWRARHESVARSAGSAAPDDSGTEAGDGAATGR